MTRPLRWILDFVSITMRPPPDATAGRIRKAGAATAALGLVLLALTVGAVVALSTLTGTELAIKLAIPLWLAGFAGTIVGAFRLVLAAEPGEMSPLKRMGLGVVFGCGSLALLVGIAILIAWLAHL